jgi:hypothetical protein
MQYHIYDIIHMISHMIYYDIKVIYYDIIEIYDIIVAQGSRWMATSSGIRIVSYVRHISGICLTYSKVLHRAMCQVPGIYLHAKSYDFIGFDACIHSVGRVHWYIEACKEER